MLPYDLCMDIQFHLLFIWFCVWICIYLGSSIYFLAFVITTFLSSHLWFGHYLSALLHELKNSGVTVDALRKQANESKEQVAKQQEAIMKKFNTTGSKVMFILLSSWVSHGLTSMIHDKRSFISNELQKGLWRIQHWWRLAQVGFIMGFRVLPLLFLKG